MVNTKNVVCYAPKNGGRPENFSVETIKHPDGVMVMKKESTKQKKTFSNYSCLIFQLAAQNLIPVRGDLMRDRVKKV